MFGRHPRLRLPRGQAPVCSSEALQTLSVLVLDQPMLVNMPRERNERERLTLAAKRAESFGSNELDPALREVMLAGTQI